MAPLRRERVPYPDGWSGSVSVAASSLADEFDEMVDAFCTAAIGVDAAAAAGAGAGDALLLALSIEALTVASGRGDGRADGGALGWAAVNARAWTDGDDGLERGCVSGVASWTAGAGEGAALSAIFGGLVARAGQGQRLQARRERRINLAAKSMDVVPMARIIRHDDPRGRRCRRREASLMRWRPGPARW